MKQNRQQIDHIMAERGPIFDSGLNIFSKAFFPFFKSNPEKAGATLRRLPPPPLLRIQQFFRATKFKFKNNVERHRKIILQREYTVTESFILPAVGLSIILLAC